MTLDADAVVIGSGIGGLSAALGLAQAGQRVIVLERHEVPGGYSQSFHVNGFRFSPGVHYVGELHEGGLLRRLFEGLGAAPDFFELFHLPGCSSCSSSLESRGQGAARRRRAL